VGITMYLQLTNYHMANEILYALNEAQSHGEGTLSKLSLQKLLYLSGALAPIKRIVLEYLHFITEKRGPYSKDIQNTVDHLVAIGLVKIIHFEEIKGGSLANYKISEAGHRAVDLLTQYPQEADKSWWISFVTKLIFSYFHGEGLKGKNDEKIKSLVYQDPTYKDLRIKGLFHHLIELDDPKSVTYKLISSMKEYMEKNRSAISKSDHRRSAEILLSTFFEYLYINYLSEEKHG
jgi:uncharacterized protein YwgA